MACSVSQLVLPRVKTNHLRVSILLPKRAFVLDQKPSFLTPQCSSQKANLLFTQTSNFPTIPGAYSDKSPDSSEKKHTLWSFENVSIKYPCLAIVFLAWFFICWDANASSNCIRGCGFGQRFAEVLRGLGWSDETVVFVLATLPVIELRGAIPVGYWLQLKPALITVLSILGNMVPVPFILLYLKKLASSSNLIESIYEKAKRKAGPIEEFKWLGLMLFVAVPCPGTGAWTGAAIASVLDMPLWSGLSANFFGVVLAGLQVNLLMNLGVKYAITTCLFMFIVSTFMWSVLRRFRGSPSPGSLV